MPLLGLGKIAANIDEQHYWEIEQKKYPLRKIISDLKNAKFKVDRVYRPFEQPYHRFFVLKK